MWGGAERTTAHWRSLPYEECCGQAWASRPPDSISSASARIAVRVKAALRGIHASPSCDRMSTLRSLTRSLTQEPDPRSDERIATIPLSESPFVGEQTFVLSSEDTEKLERIAPKGVSASQTPLLAGSSVPARDLVKSVDTMELGTPVGAQDRLRTHQPVERPESGPPAWLGIFFDLAWTATFSNLTNNTELTTATTLFDYTTFFLLAWWLWAAQVTYDSKYFRNDWFHRAMLLVQLTIFGSLSAFTKDFSPFSKSVDPKESPLEDYMKDQYARKSMLGISGLFAVARLFLVVSYTRVLVYVPSHHPSAPTQRRRLRIRIATYFSSCVLFAVAFAVVKLDREHSAVAIRMCLWFASIAIEVLSYLTVHEVDGQLLLNADTMGERLSGLTSVILGEGLNGLAGALVLGAGAIGFDVKSGGVAASATVVITFAFLLYFDGLKGRAPSSHNRSRWNVLLHFLLHLSIIVLLEALKNTLIYCSVFGVMRAAVDRFYTPKHGENETQAQIAAFRNVGVDLRDFLKQSEDAIWAADPSLPYMPDVWKEVTNKANAKLYLSIFDQFGLASDEMKQNVTDYIQTIGGAARTDNATTGNFALLPLLDDSVEEVQASARWVLIAGAVFLVCLGLLALVNSWVPKHRYVWGSILSRWLMAIVLGLLTLLANNDSRWQGIQDNALLGTIVAIAFVVQFAIDYALLWIAAWRQRRAL